MNTATVRTALSVIAGNIFTANQFDASSAPALSASNNSSTWYNSQRTAVVLATDTGGSGLAEVRYNWGSNPMNATCTTGGTVTTNAASLNAPAGGTTLYLCARDNAGNTATWNGIYNWKIYSIAKIGIFVPSTAQWYLDLNGSDAWNGTPTDIYVPDFGKGLLKPAPITGNW